MATTRKTWMLAGAGVVLLALAGVGYAAAHGGGFGSGTRASVTDTNGALAGRFYNASADVASGTITNIDPTRANATHPLIVSIALASGGSYHESAARGGYALRDDAGDRIVVEDAPPIAVRMDSTNGTTITMVLPSDATIVTHDAVADWSPAGATVTYANGEKANLRLSDGGTVSATGSTLTIVLPADGHGEYALLHGAAGPWGRGDVGHDERGPGAPGPDRPGFDGGRRGPAGEPSRGPARR